MNKLSFCVLISAVLLVVCSVSIAAIPVTTAGAGIQLMNPVSCWPSNEVFAAIRNKYDETILWTSTSGQNTVTQLALTGNPRTRTWTLVEFTAEQACVLGSGRGYIAPHNPASDGIKL